MMFGSATSSKHKENNVKPRGNINVDDDGVKESQIITNTTVSEHINIGDINIVEAYGNLQLGTVVTFNGPVHITNLTKKDILNLKETCKTCHQKRQMKEQKEKDRGINKLKIPKNVKLLNKKLNVRKCIILAVSLFLSQLIIIPSFFITRSALTVNKSYNCPGVEAKQLSVLYDLYTPINSFFIFRKDWWHENNCLVDCCIKRRKSIVRFSIVHPRLLNVMMPDGIWKKYLKNEISIQMNSSGIRLNDFYHNYFLTFYERMYEGRPLNCPFEAMEHLEEDLLNIITVGIPHCFPSVGDVMTENTRSLVDSTNILLNVLQVIGVLNKNFTLEIPDECNGTTLRNMIAKVVRSKSNLVFYDFIKKDPFANGTLQSYKQLKMDLSFQPIEENNTSNSKNLTNGGYSVRFPKPLFNKPECENKTNNFIIINAQYYNIYEFRSFYEPQSYQELKNNSRKRMQILRSKSFDIGVFNNSFNYFVLKFDGAALKDTQTDCRPTSQKIFNEKGDYKEVIGSRSIINFVNYGRSEFVTNKIRIFHYLLRSVLNDQRKYNPLLNQCLINRECNVTYFFVFDCLDDKVGNIVQLYHMLDLNVVYHYNNKYWLNTFEECKRFMF